jgi:hypothetical protein
VRVVIPVVEVEFEEGGNTLWIHAADGTTPLRFKATGKITSQVCKNSPVTHGDAMIDGDLCICIPPKKRSRK